MADMDVNVFIDGEWYGPDYPDNGNPPSSWEPLEEQSPTGKRKADREQAADSGDGSSASKSAGTSRRSNARSE